MKKIDEQKLDQLISSADIEMKDSNVEIIITDGELTYPGTNDTSVYGYFTDIDEKPKFGVARSVDPEWKLTYLHEFSHFRQWKEKHPTYTNFVIRDETQLAHFLGNDDFQNVLAAWSAGKLSLTFKELTHACNASFDVELDAERRTVQMLIDVDIGKRNISEYAQRANSYIISYFMTPMFGNDYRNAPQDVEELWRQMPNTFDNDYHNLWYDYVGLYWKHCYGDVNV